MDEITEYIEETPEKEQVPESSFATIADIKADGISLIFDGQDEPSEKHYKCNCFAVFANGDRVKVFKDSGTYVVEYPLGNPRKEFVCTVAERLATPRKIALTGAAEGEGSFDGSKNVEIKVTKITGSLSEAEKAVALKTGRNIFLSGGVTGSPNYVFDGSRDITINVTKVDASKLSGTINADTAVKLKTARTIAISGAVTGSATSFDGSSNISINATSLDASKLSGNLIATAVKNQGSGAAIQFQSDYRGNIFARVGTGSWKQIS